MNDTSDTGRLSGYTDHPNPTGRLYGNYSFGSFRTWMFGEEGIAHSKKVIIDDLATLNMTPADLAGMRVLDIGIGRQALVFHLLGANEVDHFDISNEHVNFFRRYIAKHNISKVTSTQADITRVPLTTARYDFVYLNGIIQHFDSVEDGLKNLARATRTDGLLWLYFYRSGSFKRFVVEMLRELIDASDLEQTRDMACALYGCEREEKIVSQIMDDVFVPFARLFSVDQILETMRLLGFAPYSSQKADPVGPYDHHRTHHSTIIIFRKVRRDVDYETPVTPVRRPISQLRDIPYREDIINENIRAFEAVRTLVHDRHVGRDAVIHLCLALHRISSPTYYPGGQPVLGDPTFFIDSDIKLADHDALKRTLSDFIERHGA